ncbi:MAG: phosphate acetyltransferase [Candidatus Poribacteria bacterium]|nr:phosphate acetyltransferase [Candidatus Poribacteria bacterium]
MDVIRQFVNRARKVNKRIVFPEGSDERIQKAARSLSDDGIVQPILIGEANKLKQQADISGISLDGIGIVCHETAPCLNDYAIAYNTARIGVSKKVALRLLRRPLIFAGMMVAQGDADGCVAGVANATARVIEAAGLTIGFAEGIFGVSSCFIMVIPDSLDGKNTVLVFLDCAVSIQPTAEELAQIAISTAATTRTLLSTEPKVAMLSFSTKGSASHINVDKITTATQIVRRRMPNLMIDGELQGDAALVKTVADQKLTDSPVAGNANVLIFPDLDAGNIAYKLVQYLVKAQAYGPILQGLRKSMNDMSRGASVEDLVGVAAITAVQSGGC